MRFYALIGGGFVAVLIMIGAYYITTFVMDVFRPKPPKLEKKGQSK